MLVESIHPFDGRDAPGAVIGDEHLLPDHGGKGFHRFVTADSPEHLIFAGEGLAAGGSYYEIRLCLAVGIPDYILETVIDRHHDYQGTGPHSDADTADERYYVDHVV